MKTLARERDQAEILVRLKQIRPESVRGWGRMSAPQMVCHLADAFRMALGQKTAKPRSTLLGRTMVKWVALYAPLPWPSGLLTSEEIDQERGGGTAPGEFAADVAQVEALLQLVTAPARRLEHLHPVFGPMSDAAWLRWGYLHTDHHLRQFGA